nr:immunoglobulin light chain junction region [Macaca mulatta]
DYYCMIWHNNAYMF